MRSGEGPHDTATSTVTSIRGRRLWRTSEERQADKAEALVRRERAMIEVQRSRDQREMEALEAEREKAAVRGELAERVQQEQDRAARERRTLRQRISRTAVLASANIGVNAVAVLGQVLALTLGLNWPWWAAVPLALVVESVAVNVGYIAHDKLINGYSAGWLRALSYVIGAGVGWFNYDHNVDHPLTGAFAGVFGACSLLSPVLWQIYSQWRHWQELRSQGLLEARAPKFAKLRWLIPSLRGETWRAFKLAVSEGIQTPDMAITAVRARTAAGTAEKALRQAREAVIAVQADALRLTLTHLAALYHDMDGENPDAAKAKADLKRFISRFQPFIPPVDLSPEATARAINVEPEPEPGRNQKRPSDEDNRKAKTWIIRTVKAGKPVPPKTEVAAKYRFSDKWGWGRIQDAKAALIAEGWAFPDDADPVPPVGSVNGSSAGGAP